MFNSLIYSLTSAANEAPAFDFTPEKFIENLSYMGWGMLGIFIVIGIIVASTFLLNFIFKKKK